MGKWTPQKLRQDALTSLQLGWCDRDVNQTSIFCKTKVLFLISQNTYFTKYNKRYFYILLYSFICKISFLIWFIKCFLDFFYFFLNNTIIYQREFIQAIYKDTNILLLMENSYFIYNFSVSITNWKQTKCLKNRPGN